MNVDDWKVEFKLEASPHYKVEVVTHKRNEGTKKLEEALEIIKGIIKAQGQKFSLKTAPRIVGDQNDPDVDELREQQKEREIDQ